MTAQIGDIYKINDKRYSLVARSGNVVFDPKSYGLEPHARCTACYRGYWCEYTILEEELILQNLFIFNKDEHYPPFNGVEVTPPEFNEYDCDAGKGKRKKVTLPAHLGHRVYRDVNLTIPFSGKILLGSDFMQEYYIHMGYQRGWGYKKLIELVFDEGLLMESCDMSAFAEAQREAIKQKKLDPRWPDYDDVRKFVEDCFSLNYSDKVWWLDS